MPRWIAAGYLFKPDSSSENSPRVLDCKDFIEVEVDFPATDDGRVSIDVVYDGPNLSSADRRTADVMRKLLLANWLSALCQRVRGQEDLESESESPLKDSPEA